MRATLVHQLSNFDMCALSGFPAPICFGATTTDFSSKSLRPLGHSAYQLHPDLASRLKKLATMHNHPKLHDYRRTSSRSDQVSDGDPKQNVAREDRTRLWEERVASDQSASPDAQGSQLIKVCAQEQITQQRAIEPSHF